MFKQNPFPRSAIGRLARNGGTLSVIVFAALICSVPSRVSALDWYRWRGPDLNGISRETGWSVSWPKEGPKQLWKASVGTGFSSISINKGRAYTMGNRHDTETVYCLDADNGAVIWKHSYSCVADPNLYEGGPNATPTVDGKVVYTFSRRGHVFALGTETGTVLWSKNLRNELGLKLPEWGFSGSPLVQGQLLILNAGVGGTALDKETGKTVWTSSKDSAGYSTPVPFNQAVLVFSTKALLAIEAMSGKKLWEHPWPTPHGVNAADPIVFGDRILISSGHGKGCALLQVLDGKPSVLWENRNMRNHFNSSMVLGESAYGFDESELKCLDLSTGTVRWTQRGLGKGSLIGADGKLVILAENGELLIAEATPTAFKPLSRAQVLGGKCWTSPALSNGRIYCRNAKGDLVCVDVSGKQVSRR